MLPIDSAQALTAVPGATAVASSTAFNDLDSRRTHKGPHSSEKRSREGLKPMQESRGAKCSDEPGLRGPHHSQRGYGEPRACLWQKSGTAFWQILLLAPLPSTALRFSRFCSLPAEKNQNSVRIWRLQRHGSIARTAGVFGLHRFCRKEPGGSLTVTASVPVGLTGRQQQATVEIWEIRCHQKTKNRWTSLQSSSACLLSCKLLFVVRVNPRG